MGWNILYIWYYLCEIQRIERTSRKFLVKTFEEIIIIIIIFIIIIYFVLALPLYMVLRLNLKYMVHKCS